MLRQRGKYLRFESLKSHGFRGYGLALIVSCLLLQTPIHAQAVSCASLAASRLPHTTITKAELISGGSFRYPNGKLISNLPAFCRVTAISRPSSDSDIKIEFWLPRSGWNGRLLGTGNGGFAGEIDYDPLVDGVRLGYATVNTDMGMSIPAGRSATIFFDRPERWRDWGYRSTHEMTVLAKQLVRTYYGKDSQRAYFTGCSTGGEQALSEAQRYPEDYDGIVGGDPPNARTGVHISIFWGYDVMHKTPESYLPTNKIGLLKNAVLAACDGRDGVKDGVITDPSQCKFNPAMLACHGADNGRCLTARTSGNSSAALCRTEEFPYRTDTVPGCSQGQ